MYNEFKTVHIIHVQCEYSNVLTYAKFCCGYCTLGINAYKYLNGVISVKNHQNIRCIYKDVNVSRKHLNIRLCFAMVHVILNKLWSILCHVRKANNSIFWPVDYKYFSISISINSSPTQLWFCFSYFKNTIICKQNRTFYIQKCKAIECIRIMIQ